MLPWCAHVDLDSRGHCPSVLITHRGSIRTYCLVRSARHEQAWNTLRAAWQGRVRLIFPENSLSVSLLHLSSLYDMASILAASTARPSRPPNTSAGAGVYFEIIGPATHGMDAIPQAARKLSYVRRPNLLALTTKIAAMYELPLVDVGLRYFDGRHRLNEFIVASEEYLQSIYAECRDDGEKIRLRVVDLGAHSHVSTGLHEHTPQVGPNQLSFSALLSSRPLPPLPSDDNDKDSCVASSSSSMSICSSSSSCYEARPSSPRESLGRSVQHDDVLPTYTPFDTPLLAELFPGVDFEHLPSSLRHPSVENRAHAIYLDLANEKGKAREDAPFPPRPRSTFHCGICMEDEDEDGIAVIDGCRHAFCRCVSVRMLPKPEVTNHIAPGIV